MLNLIQQDHLEGKTDEKPRIGSLGNQRCVKCCAADARTRKNLARQMAKDQGCQGDGEPGAHACSENSQRTAQGAFGDMPAHDHVA